jgi:hypothetical protein
VIIFVSQSLLPAKLALDDAPCSASALLDDAAIRLVILPSLTLWGFTWHCIHLNPENFAQTIKAPDLIGLNPD